MHSHHSSSPPKDCHALQSVNDTLRRSFSPSRPMRQMKNHSKRHGRSSSSSRRSKEEFTRSRTPSRSGKNYSDTADRYQPSRDGTGERRNRRRRRRRSTPSSRRRRSPFSVPKERPLDSWIDGRKETYVCAPNSRQERSCSVRKRRRSRRGGDRGRRRSRSRSRSMSSRSSHSNRSERSYSREKRFRYSRRSSPSRGRDEQYSRNLSRTYRRSSRGRGRRRRRSSRSHDESGSSRDRYIGPNRNSRAERRNRREGGKINDIGGMEQRTFGVVSDDENYLSGRRTKSREVSVTDRRMKSGRSPSREHKRDAKRRRGKSHKRRKRRDDGDHNKKKDRRRRSSTSYSTSSCDRDDSYGHFEGQAGTVIYGRYQIIKDVGLGTFGRVVQAMDLERHPRGHVGRSHDRRHKANIEDTVAIKIVRKVKRYHESALIEADILRDVNNRGGRGLSLCAVLLRQFDLQGHCCLVFECLGRSLYDFMKTHGFKPFPLYCVRDFAKQLLEALEFIHSFGLIHTDLKPENILLKSNRERPYRLPDGSDQQVPACTSIKLIDFGGATYDHEKKSTIINTRQYRSPEVILGLGWSMPSDMWSAGCIIAELYKGELLFATHDNFEHLALIERIVGRFPLDMISCSREFGTIAFDSYGWHKLDLSPSSQSYVRKTKSLETIIKNEDRNSGLLELLHSLLTINPCKRSTAKEALCHSILFSHLF